MNAPIRHNLLSNALREVAMIAEVKTTALGLNRADKQAAQKTNTDFQAHQGAARVSVNRLAGADDLHRDITALQEAIRANLHAYTTSWGMTSRRLLPNANFEPWIREHARLQGEFETKRAHLIAEAPNLIRKAEAALGHFNVRPPSVEEIERAYSVSYGLEPIPDGKQFSGLPDAANDWLTEQFEHNISTAYREAQLDALKRLSEPLEALVDRIGAYDERMDKLEKGDDPGRVGIFRDTLVSNVQDIGAVFGSFNLTQDPKMQNFADRLAIFMNASPDDLRKNDDLRASAKQQAQSLIDDLNDMLLPIKR